jgi:hypothetical protein
MVGDAHASDAPAAIAPRRAVRDAPRVLLLASAIGVLGQLLFVGVGLGLNMPLAVLALLAAGWQLRQPGVPISRGEPWLPIAAIAFSLFFALRGDQMLLAFDFSASIVLTALALAAFAGHRVSALPMGEILLLGARLVGWASVAAVPALASVGRPTMPRMRGTMVAGVGRGLVLGLPLTVIAIVLFASADAAFAELLEDVTRIDVRLGDLPWRLIVAIAIAWLAAGAFAFVTDADDQQAIAREVGPPMRLGSTEALTVLVLLDLVFAVFVALQAAYLFGGLDTLALTGMTYAEYARRGFFELVAVAVLAGSTVLILESLVTPRSRSYVAAALLLTALTAVVLASAALRLRLYQEAYGWTEMRFYVLTAIVFLALGLVLAIRSLVTDRSRRLLHQLFALGFGVALVANVIGPVRFVTEANIERALNPSLVPPNGSTGFDIDYLVVLDTDAVAPLVAALPDLDPGLRARVEEALAARRGADESQRWQDWSLSRLLASSALERLEGR